MDQFIKGGKFIRGTDFSAAQPGDVIFYNRGSGRNGMGRPDHVAVYLGMGKDGQPRMIHTGSPQEKSTIKVATKKGLIGFGRPNNGAAVAKMLLGESGKPSIGADVGQTPKKPGMAVDSGKAPAQQANVPETKPIAKEKPGKSKGYTDDSLTITQGPVEVGKYGVIASRTEKMPDGTERIYPIYGNPALGPTGAQVEKQIAKDRASILAKMKKGGGKTQAVAAKPQGGTERVVEESKQTYTASEGAQLKRAEAEQERASVAAPAPAVINNVTNNSSRAGTPIPAMHITTGDRDSFPSRLARSY